MTVLYLLTVPFVNGRYTKGVSFPPKMVYKMVRDRTSGWNLSVLIFLFSTPTPRVQTGFLGSLELRVLLTQSDTQSTCDQPGTSYYVRKQVHSNRPESRLPRQLHTSQLPWNPSTTNTCNFKFLKNFFVVQSYFVQYFKSFFTIQYRWLTSLLFTNSSY